MPVPFWLVPHKHRLLFRTSECPEAQRAKQQQADTLSVSAGIPEHAEVCAMESRAKLLESFDPADADGLLATAVAFDIVALIQKLLWERFKR